MEIAIDVYQAKIYKNFHKFGNFQYAFHITWDLKFCCRKQFLQIAEGSESYGAWALLKKAACTLEKSYITQ